MAISEELKKIYATAPNDDFYVETLSLEHPIFEHGVTHITNQNGGWVGNLESGGQAAYTYVPFTVIPPSSGDEGALVLKVVLDNSARPLIDSLEYMSQTPSQPIKLVFRIYINSDPETIQNSPPLVMYVSSVLATQESISFAATTTNLRDLPFPRQLYSIDLYPGLER